MIDILSRKSNSGDLCVNLARHHLGKHEWGLAKRALEDGITKGRLSDPEKASALLTDIHQRLGIER